MAEDPAASHGLGAGPDASTPAVRRVRPRLVAVFFLLASAAAVLLGAVQPHTGPPPDIVQLTQFGPAVAVGILALRWARPAGVPPVLAGRSRRLMTSAVSVVCVMAIGIGLTTLGFGTVDGSSVSGLGLPVGLLVVGQVLGACAEELGWRGFLQPHLQVRLSPLGAAVVVGLLWGLWHPQVYIGDPALSVLFLLQAVALSVVLATVLGRDAAENVVLAGVVHASINLVLLVLPAAEHSLPAAAAFTTACAVPAIGVVAWQPALRRRQGADD